MDRKEFFESTEFFARTRHKLRADGGSTLVDVAGGHGLVGCSPQPEPGPEPEPEPGPKPARLLGGRLHG